MNIMGKQLVHMTLAAALMLVSACTRIANFAEERADRAAYGNIRATQRLATGAAEPFTIDEEEARRMRGVLEQEAAGEAAKLLSLSEVLAIAMANSRSYQAEKEALFIKALSLSKTQKEYNHDFSGSLSAEASQVSYESGSSSETNNLAETFGERGVDGSFTAGVKRTLVTGAEISLDFTQNLASYLSSPNEKTANSFVAFEIVQPLLRGFGPLVSKEPLRQAERDMIYAVREFKRYQQDFVIGTAQQYYSTLRKADALRNARNNYESAIANREQTESFARAGRIAEFQAAQARQSELNAADGWISAKSNYQQALDSLRYTLGLSVDLNVEPDPAELEALAGRGLVDVGVSLEEALDSALSNRLDLVNQRQKVEDKERKLEVARRDFGPDLDVSYRVNQDLSGDDSSDEQEEVLVGLDIPFDWTTRRNSYRVAQINLQAAIRNMEKAEDGVRLNVRDLWRTLERNRLVYQNRLLSVDLSERRVESATLLLKQGKAVTRDLLEAEDDLLSSRNAATVALVDYTINRLRFWDAIERFKIDPKGMWYEQADRNVEESVATP